MIGRTSWGRSLCWSYLDACTVNSAVAFEAKLHASAQRGEADEIAKLGRAFDRRTIDSLYDVSLLQPRFLRRRPADDLGDQRALIVFPGSQIGSQIADGNADLTTTNFAVLNKLLHDPAGHVDRDREPDSDVAAAR